MNRSANCIWRGVPRPTVRPTVLVSVPNVPAAAAVNGWPGCTWLASVSAALGSAAGSVPAGLAKFTVLNRLKISQRNSTCDAPRQLEALREHQVDLLEARALDRVALEVAERAGRRRRERRRIQEGARRSV